MADFMELALAKPEKQTKTKKKREKVKSLLPELVIDFTKSPGDLILPCTLTRQARLMGWYVQEVRSTNSRLGIYEKLPMICKAEKCYWASMCPTANTNPPFLFEGLRCPLEIIEIFKSFASYVHELGIEPDDYVDLQMVADLVRMDLQLSRIDQEIQIAGMTTDQVVGIVQNQGTAIKDRLVNPLLDKQMKLRSDRTKAYKELIATRVSKAEAEQNEKKRELDVLTFMNKLRQGVEGALPKATEIIDAEVTALPAYDEDDEEKESML